MNDTICADGRVLVENICPYHPRPLMTNMHEWISPAWAEAVTHGRISQPVERHYNAGSIFKRASGAGRITHYEGLDHLLAEYGEHVAALELLPVGAPRRDWRATTTSDGMVIVRHAELPKAMEMAHRFAAELRLFAA
jgi:hypothetical protein